eukprot:scaffold107091_cov17-Prasinocladus_malaysianus.AAC.1
MLPLQKSAGQKGAKFNNRNEISQDVTTKSCMQRHQSLPFDVWKGKRLGFRRSEDAKPAIPTEYDNKMLMLARLMLQLPSYDPTRGVEPALQT